MMVLWLILISSNGYASVADIRFEAAVDRSSVVLGESVTLRLTFHGTTSMSAPDIGNIDSFDVRYAGPSTRMSIVNGTVSSSITHTYTLIPIQTGSFTISPISVSVDGKTFTSESLSIEVVSEPSQQKKPQQNLRSRDETLAQEQLKDRIFIEMSAILRAVLLINLFRERGRWCTTFWRLSQIYGPP